jgi:argininosuccinate lyase
MGGEAGRAVVTGGNGGGQLWGGRFVDPPAAEAHALGRSVHVDGRMAAVDVRASVAHVAALRDAGVLSPADATTLSEALERLGEEIAGDPFVFDDRDEDVHSAVERAMIARLSDLGASVHAGRSRNDLVVTDLRLWLLAAGRRVHTAVEALVRALLERAHEHTETVMPGTTHMRPAQVVTMGHHLCAHAWALSRDLDRLEQWASRSATSPLGAGALATSTLDLDAAATADRLGFARPFQNSLDAVSDRDFAQEWLGLATILATHCSRLAADLTRWSDPALGWAALAEAYTTGSSMMPHKRNPDPMELVRAKVGRIAGGFVTLAVVEHGLPLGYHRDLQEDKEPVFDAADTLEAAVPVLSGAILTMRFDAEAMRTACEDAGLYATDLAEALVARGVPFRDAHRRTGELLRDLDGAGRSLRDLAPEEWDAFGVPMGGALLDPDRSVGARAGAGGPSPASVKVQIRALEVSLGERDRNRTG